MKIQLIILSIILSFFSQIYGSSEHVRIAERVRSKTASKLERKYHMRLIGVGGRLMDRVNALHMSFQISYPINRQRARELIVACTEEFVRDINSNKNIQPYLANIPFTPRDVSITIFYANPDGSEPCAPFLNGVSQSFGIIDYGIYVRLEENSSDSEAFDEAIRILQSQSESPERPCKN